MLMRTSLSRGVALVNALIFAVMIMMLIGALYSILTQVFKSTEEIKTYTSVREAASAGVHYAASVIGFYTEWESSECTKFYLDYKIAGSEKMGETEISVCRLAYVEAPGQEISSTSQEPVGGSTVSSAVYKIVSISRFPKQNPPSPLQQVSRVEAVYIR